MPRVRTRAERPTVGDEDNVSLPDRGHQSDGREMDPGLCRLGARPRAQARRQVPGAQRQREDVGRHTTLIALLEFPSEEAVKAFATDPNYTPYAAARQRGSESRFQLIDDTDLAGTISYLRKAK